MAAIPLNKFKTITHTVTDAAVGIYTCPPGVASLVIFGNVSNVGQGSSITSFTVQHSRSGVDTELVKNARIPHQDAMSFIDCLLYTSPSPRDKRQSRIPSCA